MTNNLTFQSLVLIKKNYISSQGLRVMKIFLNSNGRAMLWWIDRTFNGNKKLYWVNIGAVV